MFSGIEILLEKLQNYGIKLNRLNALEVFGRSGEWHTDAYANRVKSVEIWEIDEKWENNLKKKFPDAKIKIIDSIEFVNRNKNLQKFDFVVIDNPQNVYGIKDSDLNSGYCEHFNIINKIDRLIGTEGIIVFNVNQKPYNYEKWPMWKKRREKFYNTENTEDMDLEYLIGFYENYFSKMGYTTLFSIKVKRKTPTPEESLYYFAFNLRKK